MPMSLRASSSAPAVRYCTTVGCEKRALPWAPTCQGCFDRERHEASEKRCAELGLVTVEQKREYCRKLARSHLFGRPSFERWAATITQKTVDLIALQAAGQPDPCLDRLRAAGVIDGRNRLIPAGEAREIAAEAHRMARAHEAAMLAKELAERGEVRVEQP